MKSSRLPISAFKPKPSKKSPASYRYPAKAYAAYLANGSPTTCDCTAEKAVQFAQEAGHLPDNRWRLHLRAGAIQAFEFTYELCEKMLRRFLRLSETSDARITELSFSELFRLGYKRGLVKSELREWHAFRTSRNRTSYTYSENDAQAVFDGIPYFLEDARFLLAALNRALSRMQE